MTCEKCKGTGEIEKTVYRGEEGMAIVMDVMVVCPDCEGKGEIKPSCLGAVISRFNSDIFIDNVCLSYRHDFGLMAEQDKQRLRFECKEWMRAISNNWEYFKNGL